MDQVADRTRELEAHVHALETRTEQLETIARIDWEKQDELACLSTRLDRDRIDRHIRSVVAAAQLELDPFPHILVSGWLPDDIYNTMIAAVPPSVFFADQDPSRQRLVVPFSFAPMYSRKVWQFIADEIVGRSLRDAITCKFRATLAEYVRSLCGDAAADNDLLLHPSDGRIMLRRPGYVIAPHRDSKWGFLTGLVYLARKGDNEAYGTKLYRVRDDAEAPGDKPYYVDESRCELAASIPFRANTLLVFLNSAGAHGASIPSDAQPPSLERYVYQFRLGPDAQTIKRLLRLMPPERRVLWQGAKVTAAIGPGDSGRAVTSEGSLTY